MLFELEGLDDFFCCSEIVPRMISDVNHLSVFVGSNHHRGNGSLSAGSVVPIHFGVIGFGAVRQGDFLVVAHLSFGPLAGF
jgi:hypothetical protein